MLAWAAVRSVLRVAEHSQVLRLALLVALHALLLWVPVLLLLLRAGHWLPVPAAASGWLLLTLRVQACPW